MTQTPNIEPAATPRGTLAAAGAATPRRRLFDFLRNRITPLLRYGQAATARAVGRTHSTAHNEQRAPQIRSLGPFDCPEYPFCGCPGVANQPECPGVRDQLWARR